MKEPKLNLEKYDEYIDECLLTIKITLISDVSSSCISRFVNRFVAANFAVSEDCKTSNTKLASKIFEVDRKFHRVMARINLIIKREGLK